MSLNSVLRRFRTSVAALDMPGVTIRHYWRSGLKAPFFIWAETGDGGDRWTDNRRKYRNVGGTADYFTSTELDPNVDTIESMFDELGCSWALETVDFEEDTNMIHYSWIWSVADGSI